jgi:hypothetical protein
VGVSPAEALRRGGFVFHSESLVVPAPILSLIASEFSAPPRESDFLAVARWK